MHREDVTIQFGADSSAIPPALNSATGYVEEWFRKVENTSKGYTGWWAKELEKREHMEVESATKAAEKSAAARQAIWKAELALELEQLKKNHAEMMAGSVPANMAGGGLLKQAEKEFGEKAIGGVEVAGGQYVFSKATGKLLGKLGEAEKGVGELAGHSRGLSGAMREFMVIIREISRGNWSRVPGSLSILTQQLGMGLTAIPIIGAGIAGIYGNIKMRESLKEMGHSEADKANQEGFKELTKHFVEYVKELRKNEILTRSQAEQLTGYAESGHLKLAQGKLRQILPNGMTLDQAEDLHKEAKEREREEKEIHRKVIESSIKMYNEEVQAKRDLLELHAREKKVREEATLRIQEVMQHEAESFMPTIHELAGRGIFRSQARHIMRDERRAKRAYERGDVAGAHALIADRDKIYDSLSDKGVIKERDAAREIRNINERMKIRLEEMGTTKSPLIAKFHLQ